MSIKQILRSDQIEIVRDQSILVSTTFLPRDIVAEDFKKEIAAFSNVSSENGQGIPAGRLKRFFENDEDYLKNVIIFPTSYLIEMTIYAVQYVVSPDEIRDAIRASLHEQADLQATPVGPRKSPPGAFGVSPIFEEDLDVSFDEARKFRHDIHHASFRIASELTFPVSFSPIKGRTLLSLLPKNPTQRASFVLAIIAYQTDPVILIYYAGSVLLIKLLPVISDRIAEKITPGSKILNRDAFSKKED